MIGIAFLSPDLPFNLSKSFFKIIEFIFWFLMTCWFFVSTVSQHSLLCWELIFHIFSTQQTQQMLSICRLFVLRFFAWLSSITEIRLDGRRDFIPTLVYFLEVRFPSSFGLLRFQNQNKSLHKLKTVNNLP